MHTVCNVPTRFRRHSIFLLSSAVYSIYLLCAHTQTHTSANEYTIHTYTRRRENKCRISWLAKTDASTLPPPIFLNSAVKKLKWKNFSSLFESERDRHAKLGLIWFELSEEWNGKNDWTVKRVRFLKAEEKKIIDLFRLEPFTITRSYSEILQPSHRKGQTRKKGSLGSLSPFHSLEQPLSLASDLIAVVIKGRIRRTDTKSQSVDGSKNEVGSFTANSEKDWKSRTTTTSTKVPTGDGGISTERLAWLKRKKETGNNPSVFPIGEFSLSFFPFCSLLLLPLSPFSRLIHQLSSPHPLRILLLLLLLPNRGKSSAAARESIDKAWRLRRKISTTSVV